MTPTTAADLVAPAYRDIGESLVRELARLMADPDMISLAGGYPSPALFDTEGIREAVNAALADAPIACLQYGGTEGLPALREQIVRLAAQRGTPCTPDDLVVTAGSQQGFDLLVRTLLRAGDAAVVERPTYTGPLRVLKVAGVHTLTVGVDADGLDVDELAEMLRDPRRPRPRLLYVIPTFANPSGATMTIERRLKLLALAVEHRFVVVEDDPYGQLRFAGEPVPQLAALTDRVPGSRHWVVQLGSLSKVIAPGLRVGWMIAPPEVRRACISAKQLDDLSNPGFTQATVARYLAAGRLDAHLPVILEGYRVRAQAMGEAIARHLAGHVDVDPPQGGMFMWARLRHGLAARDLLARAIEHKVTFVPGDIYYAERNDPRALRLSFSTPTPQRIAEGIARLGRAIDALRS